MLALYYHPKETVSRAGIGDIGDDQAPRLRGFPTLFVIDQQGTMVATVPFSDHDRLETLVRTLLDKSPCRRADNE